MQETIFNRSENIAKEEKYNFPEIGAMKGNMISLCRKLRESINQGKYTALISDEVGGRIPTLIIRKVIQKIHPEKELKTLFVASGMGKNMPDHGEDGYEKLLKYLEKAVNPEDNVLLVTQYVNTGETIRKMASALARAVHGPKGLDIAIADSIYDEEELKKGILTSVDEEIAFRKGISEDDLRRPLQADNVYIGERNATHIKLDERHNKYTGIAKERGHYNPSPILLTEAIEKHGRGSYQTQKEWEQFFDINKDDSLETIKMKRENPETIRKYEEYDKKPLLDEERAKIQDNINKTREDINTLVSAVLREVWGL